MFDNRRSVADRILNPLPHVLCGYGYVEVQFATLRRGIYTAIMLTGTRLSSLSLLFAFTQQRQLLTASLNQNMCSTFVLLLLSFLSSPIPLLSRQSKAVSPFVVQVTQPGSPIHLSSLNANNGHFWLGKATSSSCPANIKSHCPAGTQTAFVVSSDGHATLVRTLNTSLPSPSPSS